MREVTVQFFTEKEQEVVDILLALGFQKRVAVVLVFLGHSAEATSREIERGTDLRQSEVSLGMKDLIGRGWVTVREDTTPGKGRHHNIYKLVLPFSRILDIIGKEKKEEMQNNLLLLRQVKESMK